MSLYGMMRTSVSGMAVQADRLASVADNIANVATTGYKRSAIEFETQVLDNATASYNSGGVSSNTRMAIDQQGALRGTESHTDLAIRGNGFFVVQDGSEDFFLTRAGSFQLDANGDLVNTSGHYLMGYNILGEKDPPVANGFGGLDRVNIGSLDLKATPSTLAKLKPNVPANADIVAAAKLPSANAANSEYSGKTSLLAYNSLGNEVTLDVYFAKSAADEWEVAVYDQGASNNGGFPYSSAALVTGTLDFDATNGSLSSSPELTIPVPGSVPMLLDMEGITQLGTEYTVINATVNGSAPASIEKVEIGEDGIVSGIYQNGYSEPIYQLPLAETPAANNLKQLSGNTFAVTLKSGDVLIGQPEMPGFGSIVSGALEESNVDMATELTLMIESQRSYTANSKVFQTGSDLMDVLINLKR